jgi:hypothetical protein
LTSYDLVVKAEEGISPVELFVLQEADSDALLWELAASWTDNGTPEQRMEAVPVLREAVLALAARGLVEVLDFPVGCQFNVRTVTSADTWVAGWLSW